MRGKNLPKPPWEEMVQPYARDAVKPPTIPALLQDGVADDIGGALLAVGTRPSC